MSRRKFLQNHFRQSFESWVAGLRPACFLVTFCTMQKVTPRSPSQEAPRFCKPRISALKQQIRTTQLNPFERIEVLQTSIQHTQTTTSHNPIKSFAASRLFMPPSAADLSGQHALRATKSLPGALRFCEPQASPAKISGKLCRAAFEAFASLRRHFPGEAYLQ